MALDALRDMSLAAGAWMKAHQRGSAAVGALPGALSAVLVPAPLLLSEEMISVLAAAPSARLDAWIESGGRHPGQAATEAVALEGAMLRARRWRLAGPTAYHFLLCALAALGTDDRTVLGRLAL